MSLKTFLDQKKCFKLICGAGNENLKEIERLVAVYAASGCRFFDLSANKEVLEAAQRGLDFAIPKDKQKNYHFCVSIGTKGDRHVQKAKINSDKCSGCGKCVEICPQKAVIAANKEKGKRERGKEVPESSVSMHPSIRVSKCIGCMKCQKACGFDAIFFHPHPALSPQGRGETLVNLLTDLPVNISCIELHASETDEKEVDEIWDYLNENFNGMLSLCIGRGKLTDEQVLNRIKRLTGKRKPYTTIIQADGEPMSGGEDDIETTLPAVDAGKLIQKANLPVYLILSGGTNSKTADLAKIHGVNIHGVGMGSYARKIVREFIEREDFLKSKAIFCKAQKIASKLTDSAI